MRHIMRVLVACEESQRVCTEFRRLGHEAYSCDIEECSGGHPEWHSTVYFRRQVWKNNFCDTRRGRVSVERIANVRRELEEWKS